MKANIVLLSLALVAIPFSVKVHAHGFDEPAPIKKAELTKPKTKASNSQQAKRKKPKIRKLNLDKQRELAEISQSSSIPSERQLELLRIQNEGIKNMSPEQKAAFVKDKTPYRVAESSPRKQVKTTLKLANSP